MAVDHSFKRERPNSHYKEDGLPLGWFSIRHDHLSEKKSRRDAHGRWFKIQSAHGCIYRVPRFASRLPKDIILLDWEGWLTLNGRQENLKEELKLKISLIKWYQLIYLFPFISMSFPDPGYRLAAYIAIGLGFVSLILGSLPFLISE